MASKIKQAIAIALATLIGAGVAFGQDTTTQQTTSGNGSALSLGEEVVDGVQVGTTYVREEFDDWALRCVRTADKKDPCQLYQLMKDDQGNSVAEISIFPLPNSEPAIAGATVATPLETLLTEQLTLSVDNASAKRYPFSYCTVQGCYSRIGLTEEDISAFKHGSEAVLAIVPVAAPDKKVGLTLSLKGFTKGYEAVEAANLAINQ